MTVICDAGALIALERGDAFTWRFLKDQFDAGDPAVTHGGVLTQVWRGGAGRQALLARALSWIVVLPWDDRVGRRAGELLVRGGTTDAVDAAVVALAGPQDEILTSDGRDIARLVVASGLPITVIPI